ncbi:hypothetical protein AG1IA_01830 [Rhizoctonia solani AG-1 IA]|uniref:Uncharacterized protein n=1 Tax=Thanatephorus cucumeris (strain AG1-IA) TaxID=983506 RepID=L8X531_THACA|nr:hypothetical protein AG1IA_01830 [Rhizoctonia solani AG-1 IA]
MALRLSASRLRDRHNETILHGTHVKFSYWTAFMYYINASLLVRIRRIRIARRALGSTPRAFPSVIPNAPECSPTIASPGALPRFSGPRRVKSVSRRPYPSIKYNPEPKVCAIDFTRHVLQSQGKSDLHYLEDICKRSR